MVSTIADILWIQRILKEFQISADEPTKLYCDNILTLTLVNNLVFHSKTKHIDIDYHFISEHKSKETSIHHIPTIDQVVDIFTKYMPTIRFSELHNKLIVQSSSQISLEGG